MRFIVALGAAVLSACGLAEEVLDLAGDWQLSGRDERDCEIGCPASVPGDVHSALLKAGLMADSFWGCNETNNLWVAKHDWTFSRRFLVTESFLRHSKIVLRLEDCDTFATVFINGNVAGETCDRFLRWDFDVKPFLRIGENEIRCVFASAWRKGDEIAASYGRTYQMACRDYTPIRNQSVVRKPACHKGWDWGLCQQVTGPCGTVRLLASSARRVDYLYADTVFADDLSRCDVTVFAVCDDGSVVTNRESLVNPPLWWPNGQGDRRFHVYAVDVDGVRYEKRIGLRKLEVVTEGGALCFKVNNRPVFMKGANWIPCSAYETEQTPARYRDLLESAVAANMNMIRLWGGGQYEKDCFYDLCDELGLMVWHDQMFACATYPVDKAEFRDLVERECAHQFRRLRDHAAIALWCGGNECKTPVDIQGAAVKRYDPGRFFWPSSPCAGPDDRSGTTFGKDSSGDAHNWVVWGKSRPFEQYYRSRPRFCSEFGFQSFPSRDVALTFCAPEHLQSGDPDFEWHQKNVGGNDRIRNSFKQNFHMPKDMDATLYLSQVQQAEAIRTAVEGWRTQRPHCMGTLYWQLNDNWPVSSWSSLEYGGKWKILHYRAKRFYAPVAVVGTPGKDSGQAVVWALNDTPKEQVATVVVERRDFAGCILGRDERQVSIPAQGVLNVGTFAREEGTFLVLRLVADDVTYDGEWLFDRFKDSPVAKAHIAVKVQGLDVTLTTDVPAFYVWANVAGIQGEFSANAFTLLPDRPVTIRFKPKDFLAESVLKKKLKIMHLRDSYE